MKEHNGEEVAGFVFPVTLYNAAGIDYRVGSQEELDFHLINGWSIDRPDAESIARVQAGPVPDFVSPAEVVELKAKVISLTDRVKIVEDALEMSVSTETFSLLHDQIKEMKKEISELRMKK